jgi:hypothetical protein
VLRRLWSFASEDEKWYMLVKDILAFFFFMLPGFVLKSKLEYQES